MSAQSTILVGKFVDFIQWIFTSTDNIDNTLLHNFIYTPTPSTTKIGIQAGGEDEYTNPSILPSVYVYSSGDQSVPLNPLYDYTVDIDGVDRTSGKIVDMKNISINILCNGLTPAQSKAIATEIFDKIRALRHVLNDDFDVYSISFKPMQGAKPLDPKNPKRGYNTTLQGLVTVIDAWEVV